MVDATTQQRIATKRYPGPTDYVPLQQGLKVKLVVPCIHSPQATSRDSFYVGDIYQGEDFISVQLHDENGEPHNFYTPVDRLLLEPREVK